MKIEIRITEDQIDFDAIKRSIEDRAFPDPKPAGLSESSGLFAHAKRDERETTNAVSGPHSLPRLWFRKSCGACNKCNNEDAAKNLLFGEMIADGKL